MAVSSQIFDSIQICGKNKLKESEKKINMLKNMLSKLTG